MEGDEVVQLPDALIAVDGSRVYEPLIMFNYLIEDDDVAFSLEFQPQPLPPQACPQFLVVARHIFPPNLAAQSDGRGEDFWAIIPPQTSVCSRFPFWSFGLHFLLHFKPFLTCCTNRQ
ncbi:unnamed protein product [Hydatigera taeniaeformis]|uniref:Uncharacterized protein n=1 Tax=Hydatigena taeniaeformis TaxID=6205 RepID=A0A0R3WYV7_HYDTA|nr:unnamed protein product [Hydatigera taeniaeformis]